MEGQLIFQISAANKGGTIRTVHIEGQVPARLSRRFIGNDIRKVLKSIPLLYSICGQSQGFCATQTVEHLCQSEDQHHEARRRARDLLCGFERVREYILRFFMEWMEISGNQAHLRHYAQTQKWLSDLKRVTFPDMEAMTLLAHPQMDPDAITDLIDQMDVFLARLIFNQSLEAWGDIDNATALKAWAQTAESEAARVIHHLILEHDHMPLRVESEKLETINPTMLYADLWGKTPEISSPLIQGEARETGAFARQNTHPLIQDLKQSYGSSILLHYVARLIELAKAPASFRKLTCGDCVDHTFSCQTTMLSDNHAMSSIETARGRLYHVIKLNEWMVEDYKILSPTEWNFHDASGIVSSIKSLPFHEEHTLTQQVSTLVRAIDPCVGFEVRVQ